jgi:hypothetical protein
VWRSERVRAKSVRSSLTVHLSMAVGGGRLLQNGGTIASRQSRDDDNIRSHASATPRYHQ